MSLDPMLVVHRTMPLADASFVRLPTSDADPVVWLDAEGRVNVWHPVLQRPILRPSSSPSLTSEIFHRVADEIAGTFVPIVRGMVEAAGVPDGYYANFPDICHAMRMRNYSMFEGGIPESFGV